jgi:hypothetical protein
MCSSSRHLPLLAGCLLLFAAAPSRAGLHYSGEEIAPLPSQWRGFLLDQRQLRMASIPPAPGRTGSPLRHRYEKAAAALEKTARSRALTADEQADLGAVYVRLGNVPRALEVLRAAQRKHPGHFRIVANLGTAWQLHGELGQAETALREAVRLAPAALKPAEELHLKLIRLRLREAPKTATLDDLFGIRFVNDKGEYEPGRLAEAGRKKLSGEAVGHLQRLALWLPADGRLLWLLGELAAAYGDVRTAASMLDGCVTEFGMRTLELTRHRRLMREAADKAGRAGPVTRREHEGQGHAGKLKVHSPRPLLDRTAEVDLPPIKPSGVNGMPWTIVTRTTVDRRYRPTFPRYLHDLEGKQVTLRGFMQPLGDNLEMHSFLLIEYPVGCWYCESPEVTAMVLVEMPRGMTQTFVRDQVTIIGRLKLNATDPEDFLYTVQGATVKTAK